MDYSKYDPNTARNKRGGDDGKFTIDKNYKQIIEEDKNVPQKLYLSVVPLYCIQQSIF